MYDNVIPLGDRILVQLISEDTSEGGVVLPVDKVESGYVKAIGAGVDLNSVGNLDIGDMVYLPKGKLVGDVFIINDKEHLVIGINYISAILNK